MRLLLMALSLFLLLPSGCNKAPRKVNSRLPEQAKATGSDEVQHIAFVEIDSIMTGYRFCKDYKAIIEKKGESIRHTLESKSRALQQAVAEFQQKAQQNAYTQETGQKAQDQLQRQQAALQELQGKLAQQLDEETERYNNALRDSLQHFLADYNKTRRFSLILSKAGDNILLADKAMDITQDVVAGLNKRYKKKK